MMATSRFWRITCHLGQYPGQWQYWFREQCCAIGWHPTKWKENRQAGWSLEGVSDGDRSWSAAKNAIRAMQPGDWVVASLPHWRVGRIGKIVGLAVADSEWNPIVPPSRSQPYGENGRRILVRWDLAVGPDDSAKVVLLPEYARWNIGQGRATIRELPLSKLADITKAMKDETNWVSLAGNFAMEKALSDYIAINPGRLEAGMIAHPSINVREMTFSDKSRADVVLQDKQQRLVVAECKQNGPTLDDIKQVAHYRSQFLKQYPELGIPRALLIHGGASRVTPEIAKQAKSLKVDLVYFELQVNFFGIRS